MVSAADILGSNIKLTDLRVIGFGTKAFRECFPMGVRTPIPAQRPIRHFGNVLVQDCVFASPATNNTDGITVLTVTGSPPHSLTNAVVRRCVVEDMRQFRSAKAYSTIHLENSVATNCSVGVYFEPDPNWIDNHGPVLIRSNEFVRVIQGVYAQFHARGKFDSLTCLNNEIVLAGGSGIGIGACDICASGPSGTITNLVALNNIIRYADWSERPSLQDIGLAATDIRNAVFANNIITLGTVNTLRVRPCPAGFIPPAVLPELCDAPPPPEPPEGTFPPCLDLLPEGYRRAWINNRDHQGSLLDVRFFNNGSHGLATQQQWP